MQDQAERKRRAVLTEEGAWALGWIGAEGSHGRQSREISVGQEPGELADLVTTGEVAEELVETEEVLFAAGLGWRGEKKGKGRGFPGHAYLEGAQGRTRSRLSRGCRGAGVDGDQREKTGYRADHCVVADG